MSSLILKFSEAPLVDIFSDNNQSNDKKIDSDNISQLNYVWLDDPHFPTQKDWFLGIPPEQLNRAIENAERYNNTDFNIWLDFSSLDIQTKRSLKTNSNPFVLKNITVRDLNDIPQYKQNPLTNNQDIDVAVRSDMTRLLAVSHAFKESGSQDIYYSDFDVKDVSIDDDRMIEFMDKVGVTLGLYYDDDIGNTNYENGFMGFRRGQGSNFLDEWIIPASEQVMFSSDGAHDDGSSPIIMIFSLLQDKLSLDQLMGIEILEPSHTTIPSEKPELIQKYISPEFDI